MSNDLRQINDSRKTAIIDSELFRLNIDIAALQETRLADSGMLREKDYTFFWQGRAEGEARIHGVGFAVKNSLLSSIQPPTEGTERILTLRLSTSVGFVTIMSIYAPTLSSAADLKDQFYEELDSVIKSIPTSEPLFLLGDFNARVGGDHESWPECIGHSGIGKMNENGQRLLEVCSYRKLCISNTFFNTKPHHRVSWMHPRSHHWHQLDLVITRRANLQCIMSTRSYHSADCDTDHALVCSRVRLKPKKLHRSKRSGQPRINIAATAVSQLCDAFAKTVKTALENHPPLETAEEKWSLLRDTIHNTALTTFGKIDRKNPDWYDESLPEIQPIINAKREAFMNYKKVPSSKNLTALRTARSKVQKIARRCANLYWMNLCHSIQAAADSGNIRGMYEGMKKAFGPSTRKTAPLKSSNGEPIVDRNKQMERWAEYYQDLYSKENMVTEHALNSMPSFPVMEELDTPPTEEELSNAIDSLAHGKAPGGDGIPAEVLQCAKPTLMHHLHTLLCQCWEEGLVPQDWRDANIVTLYKNKGDRSDCNNYRGISLLSIVGKVFARVALKRLQQVAERIYPESQCGFRAQRSTMDMIFTVRQLQEKCREQKQPLFIVFVDLTKAFDLVSRKGLFQLLEKIGCPQKLLKVIMSFHEDMKGTVLFDGSSSATFPISSGVKQGCVLAPTLFGTFFSMLLSYAFTGSEDGVFLHTRSDGKLLNLSRLRAKTKVRRLLLREMLFADDAAIASHTQEGLQRLVNRLSHACKEFGLTISLKKTNVMGQDVREVPNISIDDYTLEVVGDFTYLGSTISSNLSLEVEINKRIGKASVSMSRLSTRVWENTKLTTNTKIAVYCACVLSTLLYGSETWTTYARQEHRLNSFHLRCLRRILGISWQDKVPNKIVLESANTQSMFALLTQRRLRWLGHVRRMEDGRLPKDVLYGQLTSGSRAVGRPMLRFKDVCKRDMRSADIDPETWEETAADRSAWRQAVRSGVERAEAKRDQQWRDRRERQRAHAASQYTAPSSPHICSNCHRDCHSKIGLYSHSRRCFTEK